ncbi:MAG: ATP-binding protein [Pseudomonadota bacterium]
MSDSRPNSARIRVRPWHSLRYRLIAGAAIIALVAVFAALLAAYGAGATAQLIERSLAAQQRIDLLGQVSARVSDYAVVSVETAPVSVPEDAREARRQSAAERVEAAFAQVDTALAASVAAAQEDGEAEQMRRATQSLVLARMRAQFEALLREIRRTGQDGPLRVHLDGFATQFSPLLNEAISEERRERDNAAGKVAALREWLIRVALGAAVAAAALTVLFYVFLVRPMIAQIAEIRRAAEQIGAGDFDVTLPARSHSEFGWVFGEIDRMATRLRARRDEVDADTARLTEIIDARTAELSSANDRLSQIDAERRRLFADIGHELRTPLTVILAETELGQKGAMSAAEIDSAMATIRARAGGLNRRIDDLLRVARSETGQIDLDSVPFRADHAAASAIDDMMRQAKRRKIEIIARLDPVTAIGDPDWCRQIVSGLIENAVKKTPAGKRIEVACWRDGPNVRLSVTDEGPGVPDDEIETVFERFTRGTRETSGTGFGVGLSLARWIVEQQGGAIRLMSPAPEAPGGSPATARGARVVMTLPGGDTRAETTAVTGTAARDG